MSKRPELRTRKMQIRAVRQPVVSGSSLFDVRELHHLSSQMSCSSRRALSTVVPLSGSALQYFMLLFLGALCLATLHVDPRTRIPIPTALSCCPHDTVASYLTGCRGSRIGFNSSLAVHSSFQSSGGAQDFVFVRATVRREQFTDGSVS